MCNKFASSLFKKINLKTILKTVLIGLLAVTLLYPQVPARADTSVCGQITSNTTWTSAGNNYIVTCLVQVMQGVTLTIESGTRVLFNDGTALRIDGELIARGVTFSSSNASPSKGIWAHIYFSSTSEDAVFDAQGNYVSGSVLKDSLVAWGGGGTGVLGAVNIAGASPFLDNNNIFYSSTRGVYAVGRSSSQKIHIRNNAVNANNGGGIYVSNGLLEDNRVYDNTGNKEGGGVYAISSVLNNNDVYNNDGSNGGGIFASGCILDSNTVSGNSGDSNGGGIYTEGSTLTDNVVTGNTLSAYTSTRGGGIYAKGGTLTGNTVSGNSIYNSSGEAQGGGIYCALGTVSNNTVTDNTTLPGNAAKGGGIFSAGSTISGNIIRGNAAAAESDDTSYGGGVFADGGSVTGNTIESNNAGGGSDNLGGGVYGAIATISGNTFTDNSANQGGAIYANKGTVTDNIVQDNTASLNGTVYVYQGSALGNTIQGNAATNGGGLYGDGATMTGNTLEDNSAMLGAGIYAKSSTVIGNTLTDNAALSDGGGIYAEGGTVTGNALTGNSVPSYGHGSGAYLDGVADFSYNDVRTNTAPGGTAGGVSIEGQSLIQYNNLYGNTPYDAEIVSADLVTGTLNYWGLSACNIIPSQIYDGKDAPGRGILSYAPSLYSPVPVAQLEAPTNLMMDEGESTVALSWEAIPPLPDVGCQVPNSNTPKIGYRVYYGNTSCGPFDGAGLPEGDSPIDVGNNTALTLNGLPGQTVYFTVTAYDYLGRESHFTNVIGKAGQGYWIFLPLSQR